jgi:hypothetical protein
MATAAKLLAELAGKEFQPARQLAAYAADSGRLSRNNAGGKGLQIAGRIFGRMKVARYEVPGNRERGIPSRKDDRNISFVTSNARLPAPSGDRSSLRDGAVSKKR